MYLVHGDTFFTCTICCQLADQSWLNADSQWLLFWQKLFLMFSDEWFMFCFFVFFVFAKLKNETVIFLFLVKCKLVSKLVAFSSSPVD